MINHYFWNDSIQQFKMFQSIIITVISLCYTVRGEGDILFIGDFSVITMRGVDFIKLSADQKYWTVWNSCVIRKWHYNLSLDIRYNNWLTLLVQGGGTMCQHLFQMYIVKGKAPHYKNYLLFQDYVTQLISFVWYKLRQMVISWWKKKSRGPLLGLIIYGFFKVLYCTLNLLRVRMYGKGLKCVNTNFLCS